MNNFNFVTPDEFWKICKGKPGQTYKSLRDLEHMAQSTVGNCANCDEKAWKLAGTGLCFTCTTGEVDASEDYEISR